MSPRKLSAVLALLVFASALRAGTILEVTTASATVKVNATVAPGGVPGVVVSSNTVDLYSGGVLGAQLVNSPSNGMQLLLKSPTVGERPNLGAISNPLSGIYISSTWSGFVYNGAAMWSIGRNGVGVGQITGNAVHRKDSQDPRNSPSIETELNHDGVTWINNRMPDGTLGHDPSGRFLRFQVAGNNSMSVGAYGVQVGIFTASQLPGVSTLTVAGTIETTSGGIKFPDGSVQTTAAGASSNVFDSIVLTPRSTPPASPAVGTLYIDSNTNQARWWNGSQWLVAW